MPRANRHYLPGCIWHITHRCHKKDHLLKFARDRRNWIAWLFDAHIRFGLKVFNYMVTSNHVHLLVEDAGGRDVIPKSMQLIAGRTAQEFNQRKNRKGAFWEDRYHATAVQTDQHLQRCLVYIDLNMVRAGVVKHPSEWPFCGYNEIQQRRDRYSIIDHAGLQEVLGFQSPGSFMEAHRNWVDENLRARNLVREEIWTESVAVGSREFVAQTKEKLGIRAIGRKVRNSGSCHELRESQAIYNGNFGHEIGGLRGENMYFWNH
jgi:putative transposase